MNTMDLIFFGIQGCGKGTQAKRIAAKFGYDIFEAGGELRAIVESETELGETVKSYIDHGKLVPFEIIMEVVEKAVGNRESSQKILFDGIPRDADQSKRFDEIMKHAGREFGCVHITLDLEEAVQRILKRAEVEGRTDDASEETIRKRMGTFIEKTLPIIEQYKKQEKVIEIDGKGTIEEIYKKIVEKCRKWFGQSKYLDF